MSLSIFSEKVQASGTFNIQVFLDLLGRPMIDRMSVFIRETAQNSWDARLDLKGDVDFSITVGTFDAAQSRKLKSSVFPLADYAKDVTGNIHSHCETGSPYVIVRDAGTIGLAGPTEANVPGARRNFTSFIRNVGQDEGASKTTGRGGTFGFGKTVFFRVSKPRTFIAYSRTLDVDDNPVSRLIGVTLMRVGGTTYKYTGRHWWGVPPRDKISAADFNQPLTGKEADDLAKSIGFTPYGPKDSGTSVMVIGPEFGLSSEDKLWETPEGRARIAQLMHETLGFWYWPRSMGGYEDDGRLAAAVVCDGKKEALDAGKAKYPIPLYADCLEALQSYLRGDKNKAGELMVRVSEVRGRGQRIGLLAIAKRPYRARENHAIGLVENHPLKEMIMDREGDGKAANPICRHVALVREPGQVVKYLETAECTTNGMEYAGVFVLAPAGKDAAEIRERIKLSEPPSHDDWSKEERWAALAVSDICRNAAEYVAPPTSSSGAMSDRAGRISLLLSSLWSSGEGEGGLKKGGGGGGGGSGGGGKSASGCKWSQELALIEGKPRVIYNVSLNAKTTAGTLTCTLKASLYGGGNDELPGGTDENFIGWFAKGSDGKPARRLGTKPQLKVTKDLAGATILAIANAEIEAAIAATFKIEQDGNSAS